uniref:Membrane-associated progesterone receptor component 1 n=2 Tax=Sus scrofa TaxID=9823 RepID=A0A4X1VEF4_PIG
MPRPRTSHSCPQKGIRDRPASAAASAHVKLTGGATRDRQLLADANPGLGREETSRRTRTARGLGGACLPKGLHWKGERVAPRNPRTRSNFAPPMRARVPRSIFSGPPLLLQLEEMTGKSREVWGEKRDFSLEQLRQYDGSRTPRILLAVNGKVFDVTKGSKFYGPAGPYGIFAGRDASRGLATFCLDKDALKDEYDDLSDLNAVQMESVREWEMQFKEKYDYVGRLLKPGEEPSEYTDEEDTKDHNKQD